MTLDELHDHFKLVIANAIKNGGGNPDQLNVEEAAENLELAAAENADLLKKHLGTRQ